jgi:hypothetical protein
VTPNSSLSKASSSSIPPYDSLRGDSAAHVNKCKEQSADNPSLEPKVCPKKESDLEVNERQSSLDPKEKVSERCQVVSRRRSSDSNHAEEGTSRRSSREGSREPGLDQRERDRDRERERGRKRDREREKSPSRSRGRSSSTGSSSTSSSRDRDNSTSERKKRCKKRKKKHRKRDSSSTGSDSDRSSSDSCSKSRQKKKAKKKLKKLKKLKRKEKEKEKEREKKHRKQSSRRSLSSEEGEEVEWVERTHETLSLAKESEKRKAAPPVEERDWNEGVRDLTNRNAKRLRHENGESVTGNGNNRTVEELEQMSLRTYGNHVRSWDGNTNSIEKQAEFEKRMEPEPDSYNEEFDRGKVKKEKAKKKDPFEDRNGFHHKQNQFQRYQNSYNSHQASDRGNGGFNHWTNRRSNGSEWSSGGRSDRREYHGNRHHGNTNSYHNNNSYR